MAPEVSPTHVKIVMVLVQKGVQEGAIADTLLVLGLKGKKVNVHPCTGTEAMYRPYGP